MRRGAIVRCFKEFKTKKNHPYIVFPILGDQYMIRDVVLHENGEVSYRLFDLLNDPITTPTGLQEPSFNSENFETVRLPLNLDEVDQIITQCLNSD
jgi:hypothetical protein